MSVLQMATFSVNDNLYGVDILRVREVLKRVSCSPVPGAHPAIVGLTNLRGQVVTVIDLGRRLDPHEAPNSTRDTCVIIKTDEELTRQGLLDVVGDRVGSDAVGILVDEMGEVVTVEDEQLEDPPAHVSEIERTLVKSVVQLEGNLMTRLSLERVLDLAR
ncbi:MAG: purine-binding chemotaxis protein CheW [Myxococcales bacterium]|nr:purine-binding chemotaxis protein CheW [Myxococcales bacterium]